MLFFCSSRWDTWTVDQFLLWNSPPLDILTFQVFFLHYVTPLAVDSIALRALLLFLVDEVAYENFVQPQGVPSRTRSWFKLIAIALFFFFKVKITAAHFHSTASGMAFPCGTCTFNRIIIISAPMAESCYVIHRAY